jgi:hypothetical protein
MTTDALPVRSGRITPQRVGSHLRAAGFRPVAPSDRGRQGLKIRRSTPGQVMVSADLDSNTAALEMAADATAALVDLGYAVRVNDLNSAILYVTN